MVNLRLTKMELEEIIVWGRHYQDKAEEVGMPYDEDEKKLLQKLRKARDKKPQKIETIVIRQDITFEQAKEEISEFLKKHKEADLEKIQDELRLDMELIVDVLKSMQEERKIKL